MMQKEINNQSWWCAFGCLVATFVLLLVAHEVIECVMWLDPTATWCDF